MTLDALNSAALSRLFSPGVVREMAKCGRSPLFARLFPLVAEGISSRAGDTVGHAFDAAFAVLRRSGGRSEYVYRAALTQNILLGCHSLNTASMLTEFRVGTSKADVAILNGTSTVYEIKSERDSLVRLANQISNYRKVFAKIFVIAGEAHVDEVLSSTPEEVGVLSLARWDRIKTVREAVDNSDSVCPKAIFDSLRLSEARAILRELGVSIPNLPNTKIHGAMRQCFSELEPAEAHRCMVKTLKKTRSLAPLNALIDQLPPSLQPAALSAQVKRGDHERLVDAVNTSLSDALSWA